MITRALRGIYIFLNSKSGLNAFNILYFEWLWVVVGGCGWLWMVVDGYGWLWIVVDGCEWLLMVADGCG